MIPAGIVASLEHQLEAFTGIKTFINSSNNISGGSINQAAKLVYANKAFFLKWNHAKQYPQMFEAERKGLELLRNTQSIRIPKVIGTGNDNHYSYLMLEYIDESKSDHNFWRTFGRQLAALHRNTAQFFGLDHDNYIGSLPQSNQSMQNWPEFYFQQRIYPQLTLAAQAGYFSAKDIQDFENLGVLLSELFPPEPPALLHGDLWSGNFLCGPKGEAVLIDPAVYFGHREIDLGMCRLFGGFHPDFYAAYHEAFPLAAGWENRIEISQLYPLLVHVNLFGGSYVTQVLKILRRFL